MRRFTPRSSARFVNSSGVRSEFCVNARGRPSSWRGATGCTSACPHGMGNDMRHVHRTTLAKDPLLRERRSANARRSHLVSHLIMTSDFELSL
jgi:hypothetical protein